MKPTHRKSISIKPSRHKQLEQAGSGSSFWVYDKECPPTCTGFTAFAEGKLSKPTSAMLLKQWTVDCKDVA